METPNRRSFFGLDIDSPNTPKKLLYGVCGLWLLSAIVISLWWNLPSQGQIGDMFGAVNALFSGLAFAGIIYTILLQREELSKQQEELQLTRGEFEQQNETLKLQRFENIFFQLLKFQNSIVSEYHFNYLQHNVIYKGKSAFYAYNDLFRLVFEDGVKKNPHLNDFKGMMHFYDEFVKRQEVDLGHYFGNMLELLKTVDSSNYLEDKRKYTSIIRAQLSTFELVFLFYQGKSFIGTIHFKPLIEKYGLLYRLNKDLLLKYSENAYENIAYVE